MQELAEGKAPALAPACRPAAHSGNFLHLIGWLGTVKTRSSSARRAAAAAGPATSQQPLSASAEHATSICMASVPLSEQLRFIGKRDGRPGFDVTCLGFGAATISNHRATRPAPQQPQCAPPGCAWP
jgi:hypothetical protein